MAGYNISFSRSPSFKYYISKLGGGESRPEFFLQTQDGWGVQNLGKPADGILERFLNLRKDVASKNPLTDVYG